MFGLMLSNKDKKEGEDELDLGEEMGCVGMGCICEGDCLIGIDEFGIFFILSFLDWLRLVMLMIFFMDWNDAQNYWIELKNYL